MKPPQTTYDELPYDSLPVPATSPRRLALASFLHGGPRPPVSGFRALEIGCNNGANLLPMAFYHPDSTFLGLDNADSALAAGRTATDEIGLENVRLEWMDLSAPSRLSGTFDYILIHGVFSWVGAGVRQAILQLCAAHLAPGGVLYLSHNVDAGWRIRGLVRDVVIGGVSDIPTAAQRNQRARELAAEMCDIVDESELPYHVILASELRRVMNSTESYLAHETLSPVNDAFSHTEVAAMLAEHGFSYLTDALYDHPEGRLPDSLRSALGDLAFEGNDLEQLADVLGYRRFRSSVFCRADARVADPAPEVIAGLDEMFVAGPMRQSEGDEPPIDAGLTLPRDEQLGAALLLLATEWPHGMRVPELISRSSRLIESAPMADRDIRRRLLAMHMEGRVVLSLVAAPPRKPGEHEVPHRLARHQAANGDSMTTWTHWPVGLDSFERVIVTLLGKERGIDAVVTQLRSLIEAGEISPPGDLGAEGDDAALRTVVEQSLETLGRWGLLE